MNKENKKHTYYIEMPTITIKGYDIKAENEEEARKIFLDSLYSDEFKTCTRVEQELSDYIKIQEVIK